MNSLLDLSNFICLTSIPEVTCLTSISVEIEVKRSIWDGYLIWRQMNFMNLEESELHLTIHKIKEMYWLFSLCFYPCNPLFFIL